MYYLRTRSADPLKGLGISTQRTKPTPESTDQPTEKTENPVPTSNSIISENKELVMVNSQVGETRRFSF